METPVSEAKDADVEVVTAGDSGLRLYGMEKTVAESPRFSNGGSWRVSGPETVGMFSAAGYVFGRDLHRALDVPVGLIDVSHVEAPVIGWIREATLRDTAGLREKPGEWKEYASTYMERVAAWEKALNDWMEERNLGPRLRDEGIEKVASEWHRAVLNDYEWDSVELPSTFEKAFGKMDGAVWFRRRISLPQAMRGDELTLSLGTVSDDVRVWVDGVRMGEKEEAKDAFRRYTIPGRLTRDGEVTVAVRVFDRGGEGGFTGSAKEMLLVGTSSAVRLAGSWRARVERKLDAATGEWDPARYPDAPRRPPAPNSAYRPSGVAHGMLAPVAPFAVRGVVWLQGDSDTHGESGVYGERLRVMIRDWRRWWDSKAVWFGVVQLPGGMDVDGASEDSARAQVREGQREVADTVDKVGLIPTPGVGDTPEIRPEDRHEVGRRMARWALTEVYGVLGGGEDRF